MFEFTTLFCTIDDFFQKNEAIYWQYLKQENPKVRQRSGVLCLSEIIFIAVWYKKSQLHHFKAFYGMIKRFYAKLFKLLPSYQRMIHLINQHQLALQALHISLASNAQTNCAWVDSTTLPVCKNQRIQLHKSLKQIATRGKSSMGWFYGCKLHVLVNAQGQFIQTQYFRYQDSAEARSRLHMDWYLYKIRHLVENALARLKHFRGIATRYDKLKKTCENSVALACIFIWLPL